MTTHNERIPVPFEPAQMWDLVMDVETYPKFIPWVQALRIIKQRDEDGVRHLLADMAVRYSMFRETFRSQVEADRSAGTIHAQYVRGPLKDLSNTWRFEPTETGCIVDFGLIFSFKNKLMQAAANAFVEFGFKKMSGAFIEEAYRRYTPKA